MPETSAFWIADPNKKLCLSEGQVKDLEHADQVVVTYWWYRKTSVM